MNYITGDIWIICPSMKHSNWSYSRLSRTDKLSDHRWSYTLRELFKNTHNYKCYLKTGMYSHKEIHSTVFWNLFFSSGNPKPFQSCFTWPTLCVISCKQVFALSPTGMSFPAFTWKLYWEHIHRTSWDLSLIDGKMKVKRVLPHGCLGMCPRVSTCMNSAQTDTRDSCLGHF